MPDSLEIFADDIESLLEGHPGLAKLLQHWQSICGDRPMPRREDFDPVQIPRLLADICLVEVIDGGKDYFYRVAGSHFEEMSGYKLQSMLFSEIPHTAASDSMRATCNACLKAERPVVIKSQLQEPDRDYLSITALILPLSEDGKAINMMLTMTEFEGVS